MKKTLIYSFLLTSFIAFSQEKYNPFEGIGKSTEVVTLSNGKYKEIYGGDTLKRIGSVIFDTKNNKVVQFLAEDDTVTMVVKKEGDYATRWLSLDPLAAKYPSMSPYNFVANSPILFIDPDGRVITIPDGQGGTIVYTPNMGVEGYSDATVKHINYLNNVYGGTTQSRIDKISASDVEYFVNIGQAENIGLTNFEMKQTKGGRTVYNFQKNRVEILINEDGLVTFSILGDEVVHATQFEEGQLGFSSNGNCFAFDLKDEIESKRGSVDALQQNGITATQIDPNGQYESTEVLKLIENGQDSDENIMKWLKNTNVYKTYFKKDRDEMNERITPDMDIKNQKKSQKHAYRENGKTKIIE